MNISVLTPDRQIFIGKIKSVTMPGTLGEFQIKDRHAPLVSSLTSGSITLATSGEFQLYNEEVKSLGEAQTAARTITFGIERGFVEVLNNEVSLLVQGVRNLR
jgi:F-type H+-transporting ATPase subunit epsilon